MWFVALESITHRFTLPLPVSANIKLSFLANKLEDDATGVKSLYSCSNRSLVREIDIIRLDCE